ncbi:MAG: M18 family aminopeptidase [Firmicutes bacterium]|nr:M18 family aminopeptidase [Bacillota bacterium]
MAIDNLIKNIHQSKTPYHCIKLVSEILDKKGFVKLYEKDGWKIKQDGNYYIIRADSSLIAFSLNGAAEAFNIAAPHTDSSCLKIKGNPDMTAGGLHKLNCEVYGSPIMSSWQDRKLKIAGRAFYKDKKGFSAKLIESDYNVVIPNISLHLNREVNNAYKFNPQKDLLPVTGMGKGDIKDLIGEAISYDLFVVVDELGYTFGRGNELFVAPRIDDLTGVFAALEGFITNSKGQAGVVNVLALFDNEEIGSLTRQGAASTFLFDMLTRIILSQGGSQEDFRRALASSFLMSLDNAHGTHPNHPDLSDPTTNTNLGDGIAIKHHANYHYTTDAISAAYVKDLFNTAGVKHQDSYVKSDLRAGGTLGSINSGRVSIMAADIGLAQLAMHSAMEMANVNDYQECIKAMSVFYKNFKIQ